MKMDRPTAFIGNEGNKMWIMSDTVAVFNSKDAEIIFYYNISNLIVWGIKNDVATVLDNVEDARRYFEEDKPCYSLKVKCPRGYAIADTMCNEKDCPSRVEKLYSKP